MKYLSETLELLSIYILKIIAISINYIPDFFRDRKVIIKMGDAVLKALVCVYFALVNPSALYH